MEQLYPLGTVVRLKDSIWEYVIIGYCPIDSRTGEEYTYLGVNAAYGLSVRPDSIAFHQNMIEKVIYQGYVDEQGQSFRERLGRMTGKREEKL